MDKYLENKDSAIEWIGENPKHWNWIRLKFLFETYFGGTWGNQPLENQTEGLVNVIRVADFEYSKLRISENVPTQRSVELSQNDQKLVRCGDLILEKSGGGEKSPVGRSVLMDYEPALPTVNSNFTNLMRPNTKIIVAEFLKYVFYSLYIQGRTARNIKQTTGIQNLDINSFLSEVVKIPPIVKQKQIAQSLDKQTSQIDSLIEKIERKIELLKEYRSALISQCVTKGLDPEVEMKDSGIEWIGDIPKHWELNPMFAIFEENKIKNKEGYLDVLTLSYGKIKYRDLSKLKGLYPESFDNYQVMNLNSIVIRSTDLQNDWNSLRIGYVGIPGVITSAYLGLNPKSKISTKYFYYLFHLADLKKVLYGLGGGVRQSLNFQDFKRFPVIRPPTQERHAISEYLDKCESNVDLLINKLEEKVKLLKEYRRSLISNVVTGKVRVTDQAA